MLKSDLVLAARLDAETRLGDMAALRRIARALVLEIRQRIRSVERMTGLPLRDVPERLGAWALGHTITARDYGHIGGAVIVTYPGHSVAHPRCVLSTYTPSHAKAMAAYLETRFNLEWDRTVPLAA